jgi:hypothetical protein
MLTAVLPSEGFATPLTRRPSFATCAISATALLISLNSRSV